MEQLLALEMVRVTEAAALASARFMGRGEKDEADRAAVEAMRQTMDEIEFAGRIVIGEGERDEAPMLWIGEPVGHRTPAGVEDNPEIDIAVDPLEGTNLVAHGQAGAITVLAASEKGGLVHAPDTYLEKLCVGPVAAGTIDIRESPTREPPAGSPRPSAGGPRHHRRHPRAAAPRRPDRRGPGSGSADPADQRRRPLGGDLDRACPGTGVHAVMGIGGAPEGVITAAALRCLGGEIQARFRYRSDEERARGATMGHGDEERVYHDRGPRARREPRLLGDRGHGRRPPRGRPLLRRRRPDPLPRHGLPDQAGPVRRHGPHVRPGSAAVRPALLTRPSVDARARSSRWAAAGSRWSRTTRCSTTSARLARERSGRDRPRICLIPTATADDPELIADFERLFAAAGGDRASSGCSSGRTRTSRPLVLEQDAVYVTGGNTANLLALWRLHGLDRVLRRAWDAGVVMAGMSAGAICWFESCTTDSFGPTLRPLHGGLGILDGQPQPALPRRGAAAAALPAGSSADGTLPAGYAVDDGAALVFRDRDARRGRDVATRRPAPGGSSRTAPAARPRRRSATRFLGG